MGPAKQPFERLLVLGVRIAGKGFLHLVFHLLPMSCWIMCYGYAENGSQKREAKEAHDDAHLGSLDCLQKPRAPAPIGMDGEENASRKQNQRA